MSPIAAAVHVEAQSTTPAPPTDQRDALRRVGKRLIALADDATVNWTAQGRMDARRIGAELVAQAG